MTESNKWFVLIGLLITGWLIYLLAPVLTPFMMAAILAYIGDPLVDKLEARKFSRTLAVVTVFSILSVAALICLVILIPLIEKQILLLAKKFPVYIDTVKTHVLPWLNSKFDLGLHLDVESIKTTLQTYWKDASGIVATIISSVTNSSLLLVGWLANLVLIPVVTFYLLRDWDILVARIHELIPRKVEPVISRLAKASDEMLGAFLRGQLLVMLALAIIYTTGLWIVGLDLALLIGGLSGIVSFVPYLGFIVGIVVAGIAALMQFQDVIHLVYVAIVFGIGQAVEGMLLTPLLVGDRIGLHPVAVMFAVLAGGQLFGFLGVLLALPVAAVIAVILRYLHERYMDSALYANT